MKRISGILALSALACTVSHAAAPTPYYLHEELGLDVGRTDWWHTISSQYMPSNWSSSATGPWTPLESQPFPGEAGSNDRAVIRKIANLGGGIAAGPYPLGESIYFAGSGTLQIAATDPLVGVRTVFLQLSIGEAFNNATFVDGLLPVLTLTISGQVEKITIDLKEGYGRVVDFQDEGPLDPEGSPAPVENVINLWGFQWDLPGQYTNISEIAVTFSAVPHAALYQARLDQSTTVYNGFMIPEPSTYALLLGAGVLGFIAVRRRR